mmetsp:Transcript_3758/g.4336  ORF Transcript_3758/g.4336 Transcript_3758/m.4336 type:complete len:174 (+) Transcript_3758:40-561(+)
MFHEDPHSNDVLCGRGHVINAHPGNVYFRSIVNRLKLEYVMSEKVDKKVFASVIVESIKSQNPPGRFLKQDKETKLWYNLGGKTALKKTRQALREGAPIIKERVRKRLEQQKQLKLYLDHLLPEKEHQNKANKDHLQVPEDNICFKSLDSFPNTFSTVGPLEAKRRSLNANVA